MFTDTHDLLRGTQPATMLKASFSHCSAPGSRNNIKPPMRKAIEELPNT